MPAGVDVIWCDITQSLVITPVVIVVDEGPDCFLQPAGHIVRHLINFSFYGAMVVQVEGMKPQSMLMRILRKLGLNHSLCANYFG